MNKKLIPAGALAMAAMLTLGACGSGNGGDAAGGDKTITVWHTESTPKTVEAFDEIIADFEAANPGYKVTQESVAWGDLQVKMQAALAAGDLPELTQVEPMFVKTLYDQDLLRDLDEVIDSFDGDYMPFLEDLLKQDDGKNYGVVHAWGVDATTYRTDFYDKAGVDANAVATWDEFSSQLKAVGAANPGVSPLSLAGAVAHNVQEELYMWLGSNGGSLFDKDGAPTINTPELKEVLEFWKQLKDDGSLDPGWSSAAYADTLSNLALGKASTIFSFGRATYTFEEQAPELATNGGIGVVPTKPVGPSGDDWLTQLDAEPWVAFKDADQSDAAAKFLEFFYEKDNYLKWIGSVPTQLLPVQPSMFDDSDYNALPEMENWRFWIDTQREILESGHALPLMITNQEEMKLPYVSDLYGSGILNDLVLEVVENGSDIDSSLENAQARAEELLSGRY